MVTEKDCLGNCGCAGGHSDSYANVLGTDAIKVYVGDNSVPMVMTARQAYGMLVSSDMGIMLDAAKRFPLDMGKVDRVKLLSMPMVEIGCDGKNAVVSCCTVLDDCHSNKDVSASTLADIISDSNVFMSHTGLTGGSDKTGGEDYGGLFLAGMYISAHAQGDVEIRKDGIRAVTLENRSFGTDGQRNTMLLISRALYGMRYFMEKGAMDIEMVVSSAPDGRVLLNIDGILWEHISQYIDFSNGEAYPVPMCPNTSAAECMIAGMTVKDEFGIVNTARVGRSAMSMLCILLTDAGYSVCVSDTRKEGLYDVEFSKNGEVDRIMASPSMLSLSMEYPEDMHPASPSYVRPFVLGEDDEVYSILRFGQRRINVNGIEV